MQQRERAARRIYESRNGLLFQSSELQASFIENSLRRTRYPLLYVPTLDGLAQRFRFLQFFNEPQAHVAIEKSYFVLRSPPSLRFLRVPSPN